MGPSVPGESERMRMDRAMAKVLQMLRKAGAVVPENLRLEHRCRDMQHAGCFVYQFGTRQLHISTRSVDAERLRVLVRNGGGFDNFMAFALRQGKAETARLQKQPSTPRGSISGTPRGSISARDGARRGTTGELRPAALDGVVRLKKRSASHGTPMLPRLVNASTGGAGRPSGRSVSKDTPQMSVPLSQHTPRSPV